MHKEFHAYVPRPMLLARRAGLEIEASNLVEGINTRVKRSLRDAGLLEAEQAQPE